jgi:hypothetical protein
MKASFELRAISPAIATIGLISVAIAASIPAIAQLQTQAHNSAPDTYAVSIDVVKLSDTKAWFYVNQSDARYICVNILQDASAWGPLFCTSDKTSVTTADIAMNIGDRYSVRVDLHDAADKVYASKNVAVIVR